ncbi:MAG: hypothetical protein U5Q44_04825 [Dehalococcoidia bacterium]|nr:hypothetical protein [Dehalococcoidia bacterium]
MSLVAVASSAGVDVEVSIGTPAEVTVDGHWVAIAVEVGERRGSDPARRCRTAGVDRQHAAARR